MKKVIIFVFIFLMNCGKDLGIEKRIWKCKSDEDCVEGWFCDKTKTPPICVKGIPPDVFDVKEIEEEYKEEEFMVGWEMGECDSCQKGNNWDNGFKVQEMAQVPLAVHNHTCSQVGNFIYLFGGNLGYEPGSDKIYRYNIEKNLWEKMNAQLPYGMLWGLSSAESNGKIYLGPAGGPNDDGGWGHHSNIIEYDPVKDITTTKVSYGFTVWAVNLINYDGVIYSLGGWTGSGVSTIYIYDTLKDSLIPIGNMPKAVGQVNSIGASNGKIYIFGGNNQAHEIFEFDPVSKTSNTMKSKTPLDTYDYAFMGAWESMGKIYNFYGNNKLNISDVKLYSFDYKNDIFADTGYSLNKKIQSYCLVPTADAVFIIGGYDYDKKVNVNTTLKIIPSGK